jgi:hypothetical protein
MKKIASTELAIPERRLCDHIFQYSPAIHRDRLYKYLERWEKLEQILLREHYDDKSAQELINRNYWFIDNTNVRLKYQTQISIYRDLHRYVVQLASIHSTSGALQTYAESLSFVVRAQLKVLKSRWQFRRKWASSDVEKRLQFLHRKQRAHPGFDVHTLLRSLLSPLCLERCEASPANKQQIVEEMKSVEVILEELDTREYFSNAIADLKLNSFVSLPEDIAAFIDQCRSEIWNKLAEPIDSIFKDVGVSNTRYVVSHGYSRTVLSVLKKLLAKDSRFKPLPKVFFIIPTGDDSLDTRIMEYELKEPSTYRHGDGDNTAFERQRRERQNLRLYNFAAGTERHLLGLLKEGDSVLILLGAECFDTERHVVHARGILQGLENFMEDPKFKRVRSMVVVVAESYKEQEMLRANINFYGQHFDRIDLYDANTIHTIVTDKGIINPPTRS